MAPFLVSTYFQALPFQQQLMARFELAGYLSVNGEQELAKAVCNAATPEGLAPHLSAVDKIIKIEDPNAVFRSSRMFSPAGELLHGPIEQIERPMEERQAMLASLGGEIRIRNPKGVDSEGAALAETIEGLLNDDALKNDRPRIEALITESQGYLAGLAGDDLDEKALKDLLRRSEDAADASVYGARLFVDAVRGGYIPMRSNIKSEHLWLTDAFMDGALDVWDCRISKGEIPPFIEKASRYWARAHGTPYADASRDYSREIGKGFALFMLPRMKVALAAGLKRSLLNGQLHLLDVEMFIYGRGWLRGRADSVSGSEKLVETLRKNIISIVARAVQKRDAGYTAEALLSLPDILASIDDGVARLKKAGQAEASEIIFANHGVIAGLAIRSGWLNEYAERTIQAVPDMIKAIDDGATALEEEGESEAAETVRVNRRSIISTVLHAGMIEGYLQKVFKSLPDMLSSMDDEMKRLEEAGKSEAAKAVRANRGNIIYHAIHGRGLKGYVAKVFKTVSEMISSIDDEVARLREAGESEAAETILANRGLIMSRAISSGGLSRHVKRSLDAVPDMLASIDGEVARLRKGGESELADIISVNRRTILVQALGRGQLATYLGKVFKAVPRMLSSIKDGVGRLEGEGEREASEAIDANRGSIISIAIDTTSLERYVDNVFVAVPRMLSSIYDEAAKLESSGEEDLATAILANRRNIVYRALRDYAMERYVSKTFKALPDMMSLINDEVSRLEREGEPEVSRAIADNRASLISRAIGNGMLERYLVKVFKAMPEMLIAIDDGSAKLRAEGAEDAADAVDSNRATIINRAISWGGLGKYVRKSLESAPNFPWMNGSGDA